MHWSGSWVANWFTALGNSSIVTPGCDPKWCSSLNVNLAWCGHDRRVADGVTDRWTRYRHTEDWRLIGDWLSACQALRVVGGARLPSVFFESRTNVGKLYLDHLKDLRS